jgi:hypothetical protein
VPGRFQAVTEFESNQLPAGVCAPAEPRNTMAMSDSAMDRKLSDLMSRLRHREYRSARMQPRVRCV